MKRKSLAIVLVLSLVLVAVFAGLALTACNKDTPEEIKDHSVLFSFLKNYDNASYTACFSPDSEHIIPERLYVPSEYGGFPVTCVSISDLFTTSDNVNAVKSVYLPSSIIGGYIGFKGGLANCTVMNDSIRKVEFYGPTSDAYFVIENKGYASVNNYLKEKYPSEPIVLIGKVHSCIVGNLFVGGPIPKN